MRFAGACVACIAGLLAGTSPTFAEDDPAPISWQFIQQAESAQFADGNLILSGVAPEILAFSDRPYRVVTSIALPDFAGYWAAGIDSFGADPPNAGVTMLAPDGMRTAIIEIGLPHVADETLVYPVNVLSGHLPGSGTDIALFIDAFPTAVNSQVTDSVTQANVEALGDAPAMTSDALYAATAQALADAKNNAVYAQQQANVGYQSSSTLGVPKIGASADGASGASDGN